MIPESDGDGHNPSEATTGSTQRCDVLVVGAGFSGLYLVHRLQEQGIKVLAVERGEGVGGTWYWNRYPGARCDIESVDYCYSFSPELVDEWDWSERYAAQPEILEYLNHVADRFDLRRSITFGRRVLSTRWSDEERAWTTALDDGSEVVANFVVMATGNLSTVNEPSFAGVEDFSGRRFHTGRWPHEPVDFGGRRVAVIGTGSSGIQCIPKIAEQAEQLYVLQRTPNYSMPAQNRPLTDEERDQVRAEFPERRALSRISDSGVPLLPPTTTALGVGEDERSKMYEIGWQRGGPSALSFCFNDLFTVDLANRTAQDFARTKIRDIVENPETARTLSPEHYIGTKRTCVDTDYYRTFNRSNVELVDVRVQPISTLEEHGVRIGDRLLEVDDIVFATGFDAVTGALAEIDISGVDGLSLKDAWADGPKTYLGLQVAGFPNFFMVTGPQSPATLSNMAVSIEQHVEWISDCLVHLRSKHLDRIEALPQAQDDWVNHVREAAEGTLYLQTNSWYLGANIPGKPRVFMPYVAGCGRYREECDEIVADGYRGFALAGSERRELSLAGELG